MDIILDYEKLSMRADEVDVRKDNKEVREIAVALKNKIRENNITYLTAPQIGFNKRIFVINFNGDLRTFVNPIISNVKGFELSKETCESIPEKAFIRPRHNNITIMYQTPLGKIESRQIVGMAAKLFQHCVDHLDGLLLNDIGLEIDEDFEKATKEEQEEVIKMYLESLDIKQKDIDKEIQEDDELKKISDGIDFMTKVQKGEIQIERVSIQKQSEENKE